MTNATANALAAAFAGACGAGAWRGMVARPSRPVSRIASTIRTSYVTRTPFCGPAAFIRALAIDKPDAYVRAATDLFNTGKATTGALKIEPGSILLAACMPDNISHADWLMLSSLRDSSNALLTAADNS